MSGRIDQMRLDQGLQLLAEKLELKGVAPIQLVVCGGSALIQLGFRSRTTKDLDVVALLTADHQLASPDPLPASLLEAADQVGRDMGFFQDWLNNGPSRGDGDSSSLGSRLGWLRASQRSATAIVCQFTSSAASTKSISNSTRRAISGTGGTGTISSG